MKFFKTQPDPNHNDNSNHLQQDYNYIKKPTKVTNSMNKSSTKPRANNREIVDKMKTIRANPNRRPVKLFDESNSPNFDFNQTGK